MLLTLFGVAAFSTLGTWQLDRAAEKEKLFAAFANATKQAPVTLDVARRTSSPTHFPFVNVRGRYDRAHTYEIVDQARADGIGSLAFAVFEPADGSTPILVDRGFMAGDARGDPPKIPPPPDGEQQLSALYAPPPGTGLHLGGNPLPRQKAWPKQSIYLDVGEIGEDLGRTLDRNVLLLAPDEKSGFVREWRPNVFPPARHRGYALTWFTLAGVCVIVFIVMHRLRNSTT